jgi:Rad3-related DNA helicase
MTSLLLNFPDGYNPNDAQVSILKKIEAALVSKEKFIVVNAPTGSGKSFIPKTLANALEGPSENFRNKVRDYSVFGMEGSELIKDEPSFGVYALTITKALQDQYKNTFDDTGILKGQGNYICQVDTDLTVDIAPCIYVQGLKQQCWSCNKCTYYNDRNDMLTSKFSSLNYSMFFSLPEHLKKRKIIVCDEASELEEQLVGQFTCIVDIPFLVRTDVTMSPFPSPETPANVLAWLGKLSPAIAQKVGEYLAFFEKNKGKGNHVEVSKKRQEYTKMLNLQKSVDLLIGTYYDSQYIIEHVEKNIKFTPLKVDKLAKYLFDYADHVILLSATIIDPPNFCKTLGIEKYEYIEVKTGFDPKKAPIYVMVKQKLNFQNLQSMLPTLRDQIEGILENHKTEKGIIHTHTQYITNYVRDNVRRHKSRLLCREQGVKNEELLEAHEASEDPTVLVSPSMTYGVDLKGDLATFQILLKAPWLPTKEPRVEKMMKLDKNWYANKMLCTLVQACGRGIRSTSDECVTYILDGSIYDQVARSKSKLPSFFIDRFE